MAHRGAARGGHVRTRQLRRSLRSACAPLRHGCCAFRAQIEQAYRTCGAHGVTVVDAALAVYPFLRSSCVKAGSASALTHARCGALRLRRSVSSPAFRRARARGQKTVRREPRASSKRLETSLHARESNTSKRRARRRMCAKRVLHQRHGFARYREDAAPRGRAQERGSAWPGARSATRSAALAIVPAQCQLQLGPALGARTMYSALGMLVPLLLGAACLASALPCAGTWLASLIASRPDDPAVHWAIDWHRAGNESRARRSSRCGAPPRRCAALVARPRGAAHPWVTRAKPCADERTRFAHIRPSRSPAVDCVAFACMQDVSRTLTAGSSSLSDRFCLSPGRV